MAACILFPVESPADSHDDAVQPDDDESDAVAFNVRAERTTAMAIAMDDDKTEMMMDPPHRPAERMKPGGLLPPPGAADKEYTFRAARLIFPAVINTNLWPRLFPLEGSAHGNERVVQKVLVEAKRSVKGLWRAADRATKLAEDAEEYLRQMSNNSNASAAAAAYAANKFQWCLTVAKERGIVCDICYESFGEFETGTLITLCNMNALKDVEVAARVAAADARGENREFLEEGKSKPSNFDIVNWYKYTQWESREVCWRFAHTLCFGRHWLNTRDRTKPHRPKLFFCSNHRNEAEEIFDKQALETAQAGVASTAATSAERNELSAAPHCRNERAAACTPTRLTQIAAEDKDERTRPHAEVAASVRSCKRSRSP
jgi:hypothetical protein